MSRTLLWIVGAPRSGTSLLQDLLSAQPELGWINQHLHASPEKLTLAGRNCCYDWPLLGDFWFERRYWKKKLPAPLEEPLFWEHLMPGFRYREAEPKLYDAASLTTEEVTRAREAVDAVHAYAKREWLMGQYCGPARVALLREVFPQSKFIQLQRDPRSVAIHLASHLKQESGKPFWEARAGWRALMPEALQERLDRLPDTPLNFAGVMVRWWHYQYREEFTGLPAEDVLTLAYADLLGKTLPTVTRALKFLGFDPAPRLVRYLKFHALRERNRRINKDLPEAIAAQLEAAVQKI